MFFLLGKVISLNFGKCQYLMAFRTSGVFKMPSF